jgi:chromosome segregation ATPase
MDTSHRKRSANGSVDDDTSSEARLAVEIVGAGTDETVECHRREESASKQVSVLKKQLAKKDEKLKECQRVISNKDDVIASLRGQVHALQQQLQERSADTSTTIRLGLSDVEAESTCAEPAASCSSYSSSDEGGL